MPKPQKEFKELFTSLNARGVEYLVVGAYAMAFHGVPRFTGDVDVLVRPTKENAKRLIAALDDFGFGSLGLTIADFSDPDQVVQLGVAPLRVDILTSISGVSWEQAILNKCDTTYGKVPVPFLGLNEIIANKRAVGRMKDMADIELLESVTKKRN
ncbi:MAG TPA: nucleotidyltransferase [bacterium]|nr:nucleotidyltransferase [bacterium]